MKIKTGVCASIIEEDKEKILERINQISEDDIDYIELRLDVVKDITSKKAKDIIESVKNLTQTPIILTNRTQKEGGHYPKEDDERIRILADNAPLVEITDIELSTDKKLRQKVISKANRTIISYHNFNETPSQEYLQDIINRASDEADIAKIAVKPNNMEDTYTIIRLLMENNNLIAISMGKIGSYTRIIAPLMGSPVTYASIEEESAPGQLNIKTTSEIIKKLSK